jgi:hypothetical protein
MCGRTAVRHRIARIDREVYEYLFELAGIDFHVRQPGLERRRESNLRAERAGQHCLHLHDDAIEVDTLDLHDVWSPEGEQLTGERAGALGRGQQFGDLRGWGAILQHLAVSDHDRQQVVEVVRDVTGECADGFDALDGLKMLLALLQIALGVNALDLAGNTAREELQKGRFVRLVSEIVARDDDQRADDFIPGPDQRHGDIAHGLG